MVTRGAGAETAEASNGMLQRKEEGTKDKEHEGIYSGVT